MKLFKLIASQFSRFLLPVNSTYAVLIVVTATLVTCGYLGWRNSGSPEEASQWATYASAIVSTIALVWLVAWFQTANHRARIAA